MKRLIRLSPALPGREKHLMLEIIALVYLCKTMGNLLRNKGRKPIFMQVMVVVGWFVSMFAAAFGYGLYLGLTKGPEAAENVGFVVYPIMLVAALLAEGVIFGIAALLSSKVPPRVATNPVAYDINL